MLHGVPSWRGRVCHGHSNIDVYRETAPTRATQHIGPNAPILFFLERLTGAVRRETSGRLGESALAMATTRHAPGNASPPLVDIECAMC